MLMLLRHLVAIAILPFTVTVLVPLWLSRRSGIVPSLGASSGARILQGGGLLLLLTGLVLFFSSLRRFAVEGRGLPSTSSYIPLLEEPFLRLRFGEAYREYCRHVPRMVPRLRPWKGGAGTS